MQGCSHIESETHRSWLVGSWVQMSEDGQFPTCDGDQVVAYKADGTFSTYWDSGTWRLDDDQLTLVITEILPHFGQDDRSSILGKPIVLILWWTDPNRHFQESGAGTHMDEFRRCPLAL